MRHLRSYERMAAVEHWCDRCCDLIYPGELYEGEVYATRKGGRRGIIVFRQHLDPPCEPPEEPDWDDEADSLLDDPCEAIDEPLPQAA